MLYVTTKNGRDVFTVNHTLINNCCSQGGLYVPYSLTPFHPQQIAELSQKSFGQCVADILNLFFSAKLGDLDVEFSIGKTSFQCVEMSHKLVFAENWHNSMRDFSYNVNKLFGRIREDFDLTQEPSNWVQVVVRIAFLFGLYSHMLQNNLLSSDSTFDVSVCADDFASPMAAWYARKMGLPIGNIICGCMDDDSLWELLHHKQLKKGNSSSFIERLIWETMGEEEMKSFYTASSVYTPDEEKYHALCDGMFAAVVSQSRIASIIRNVYKTSGYMLSKESAVAYSALQDFRSSSGAGITTLILCEKCPVLDCNEISSATGVSELDIKLKFGSV